MSDVWSDPLYLVEYERAMDRDLDQVEWEREQALDDPRPPKRYRATRDVWQTIREQFSTQRCWTCGDAWTDLHHLVPRSRSGDDVPGNLIPLCRICHGRVEARDPVVRSLIRQSLTSTNYAYLSYRIGKSWDGWLDRNYAMEQAA